jgi:hypothetical protein
MMNIRQRSIRFDRRYHPDLYGENVKAGDGSGAQEIARHYRRMSLAGQREKNLAAAAWWQSVADNSGSQECQENLDV